MVDWTIEERIDTDIISAENLRSFLGRDLIRISDLNPDELLFIWETGREIARTNRENRHQKHKAWTYGLAKGKEGALIFTENSSRTFNSSYIAMRRLGIDVVIAQRSSAGTSDKKDEATKHAQSMLQSYDGDIVAMRHHLAGAPQWVADYYDQNVKTQDFIRPVVINCGDDSHEHPTQALLDGLTIYQHFFRGVDGEDIARNLKREHVMTGVTLYGIGDSKAGRTIKSLAKMMASFNTTHAQNELVLVGPEAIRMPDEEIDLIKRMGMNVRILATTDEALEDAKGRDRAVLYSLRPQLERLHPADQEIAKRATKITAAQFHRHGIVGDRRIVLFHPLPTNKNHPDFDAAIETLPNFLPYKQAGNGVPARTALFGLTLGAIPTLEYDPYIDPRLALEDYEKVYPIDVRKNQSKGDLFERLQGLIADRGAEAVETLQRNLRDGMDTTKAVCGFVDSMSEYADDEDFRHITFRFLPGEIGTVIDHLENGRTGIIRYQAGLSEMIGTLDQYGNPIVVATADGLASRLGLKGIVKERGHHIPPETFHQSYHLSPEMTISWIDENGQVIGKWGLNKPRVLTGYLDCNNSLCISRSEYAEAVPTKFYLDGLGYRCRFCDSVIPEAELSDFMIKQ